jgi:hypothetical protein
MKPRRCLKFTAYVYLPNAQDATNYKTMRKFAMNPGMGRIKFFDDEGIAYEGKMFAFGSFAGMLHRIMTEYTKRIAKRIPTKKVK